MPYGILNTDTITSSTGNLIITGNVTTTGGVYSTNTPGINRIINGNMRIDQRNNGNSQVIVAGANLTYTVDRWYAYCTGANVTGQRANVAGNSTSPSQYAYQFTGASSVTGIGFGQRIEAINCFDLAGSTATLSVNMSNSGLATVTWTAYYANTTDTFGTVASPTKTQIATGTFSVSSTNTIYSTQISIPSAATTGIEIVFTVGAQTSGTWVIGNVQLEAGSMMSVFERRLITQEQMLCYRYFLSMNGTTNPYQPLAYCLLYSTTTGTWIMNLPCTMRIVPTITTSGTLYVQPYNIAVSSLAGPYSQVGTILEGDFTLVSSTTSGTSGLLRWNNIATGSRSFNINAEL